VPGVMPYRVPVEPCPNCESTGVVQAKFRVLMNWRAHWLVGTVCKSCAPVTVTLQHVLQGPMKRIIEDPGEGLYATIPVLIGLPGPRRVEHFTLNNLDRLWPQIEQGGLMHATVVMGAGGRMGQWLASLFDKIRISREMPAVVGPPPSKMIEAGSVTLKAP